jgi:L-amino acid N-acyltransferase YncA
VIIAEIEETGSVAFAAPFPYSDRACYSGIGEFSVCVRRDYRGRGAGRAVLAALIEVATAAGLHKLTSRVFRAALRRNTARRRGFVPRYRPAGVAPRKTLTISDFPCH